MSAHLAHEWAATTLNRPTTIFKNPHAILSLMALTLSPATEARIQRETSRGAFTAPDELINRLLDLIEEPAGLQPTAAEDDWLFRNREAINASLHETMAQARRGEGYTPEESMALLAANRAARQPKAA
jgi:predicted transcriptional regulator